MYTMVVRFPTLSYWCSSSRLNSVVFDIILALLIIITSLLIVIIKALNSTSNLLEFELNISAKCIALKFKIIKKALHPNKNSYAFS